MMTEFINLTWHDLCFVADGKIVTIKPSGKVARVPSHIVLKGHESVDGVSVPVTEVTYADIVDNLPEPKSGIVYIASSKAAEVARRGDVLSPNTNAKFRVCNESGKIIGCTALQRWV